MAAGVSNETRQDILGHKNGDITTRYSAAELSGLLRAVRLIRVGLVSAVCAGWREKSGRQNKGVRPPAGQETVGVLAGR
jgi:hypothetical protein